MPCPEKLLHEFSWICLLCKLNSSSSSLSFSMNNLFAKCHFLILLPKFTLKVEIDLMIYIAKHCGWLLFIYFFSISVPWVFCFLLMLGSVFFILFFHGSTAFLIGPKRQVTMMLDPVRIYATAMYIASIIIALFCALYVSGNVSVYFSFI